MELSKVVIVADGKAFPESWGSGRERCRNTIWRFSTRSIITVTAKWKRAGTRTRSETGWRIKGLAHPLVLDSCEKYSRALDPGWSRQQWSHFRLRHAGSFVS